MKSNKEIKTAEQRKQEAIDDGSYDAYQDALAEQYYDQINEHNY